MNELINRTFFEKFLTKKARKNGENFGNNEQRRYKMARITTAVSDWQPLGEFYDENGPFFARQGVFTLNDLEKLLG